jgi:hypothetical protein
MPAFRSNAWSLTLIACAAIGLLACGRPEVHPVRGAPPGNVPRGSDGGVKLPDAAPTGPSGSPAGPSGGQPGAGGGSAGAGGVLPPHPIEGGEACAMDVHQAERPPVDLLLVLDSSSSMEENVPGTGRRKGDLVTDAMISFVKDRASAGLGVGLQLFPGTARFERPPATPSPCQSDMDCRPNLVCRVRRECLAGRIFTGSQCPEDQFTGPNQRCPGNGATGEPGTCVDAARCALSNAPCSPPGQPCPGGKPGDVCQLAPRQCLPPSGGLICQPSTYEKLVAPLAVLPGAEPPLVQALQNVEYTFGTPMGPAVEGALAHARKHQAANPTHRVAMVLATDGAPGLCLPQDDAGIAALVSAASMGPAPVSTYAIGVFANSTEVDAGGALLEKVATAGGTGKPFILNTDPNLARTFLDALEKIRQASLPCEFLIPRPNGPIDFGKVNVRVQDAAGTPQEIPYVTAVNRCDPKQGGWYYDVDPTMATPTRVMACPATCDQLEAGSNANVSLVFGCKTRVIE